MASTSLARSPGLRGGAEPGVGDGPGPGSAGSLARRRRRRGRLLRRQRFQQIGQPSGRRFLAAEGLPQINDRLHQLGIVFFSGTIVIVLLPLGHVVGQRRLLRLLFLGFLPGGLRRRSVLARRRRRLGRAIGLNRGPQLAGGPSAGPATLRPADRLGGRRRRRRMRLHGRRLRDGHRRRLRLASAAEPTQQRTQNHQQHQRHYAGGREDQDVRVLLQPGGFLVFPYHLAQGRALLSSTVIAPSSSSRLWERCGSFLRGEGSLPWVSLLFGHRRTSIGEVGSGRTLGQTTSSMP